MRKKLIKAFNAGWRFFHILFLMPSGTKARMLAGKKKQSKKLCFTAAPLRCWSLSFRGVFFLFFFQVHKRKEFLKAFLKYWCTYFFALSRELTQRKNIPMYVSFCISSISNPGRLWDLKTWLRGLNNLHDWLFSFILIPISVTLALQFFLFFFLPITPPLLASGRKTKKWGGHVSAYLPACPLLFSSSSHLASARPNIVRIKREKKSI